MLRSYHQFLFLYLWVNTYILFSSEMRLPTAGLLVLLGHLALTGAWEVNFKRSQCYQYGLEDLETRMPLTLYNLVALLEKIESSRTYMNPDAVAEALLNRYRVDGITYTSLKSNNYWSQNDIYESAKAELLDAMITIDQVVPESTYEPREECSLHFMLSHSVDLYPHAGLDYVWESTSYRAKRDVQSDSRFGLPLNVQAATHPIENGVIWTSAGPVAAGTLLAGIMAPYSSQGMTINEIYQGQGIDFMPSEMTQKRLIPLHAATLAGDIGQSAMIGYVTTVTTSDVYLGPRGLFANSTAAPKLFTLERNYDINIPYLTRAEIFAGIDSLLISKVLRESTNNQLSLSQALRMYYSEHGLPGYPDYKACNRMEVFKSLDRTSLEEQALHFMYAYSAKIQNIKEQIKQYQDDFPTIESAFQNALRAAFLQFTSFVDSYDYSDYDRCPSYTSNQVMCENKVDLLVVYGYEGGETETQKERDYIAHLGQMLDVGTDRSRIGVLDGKTANWIFPMTNFSNVADWGSNFSTSTSNSFGSGSDMMKVMAQLTAYYFEFYNHMRSDASNASANAQVVLWNAPNSVPQQEEFLELMEGFRLQYPDVYFLFVGKSKGSFNDFMVDPNKDYFTNSGQDMEAFAEDLAKRICEIPSVFVYPACNPDNANFTNYPESSHTYTGYISPNFTTYIKIAPHYFHFSEKVVLKVSSGDVTVCSSRTSMDVDTNVEDRLCHDTDNLEWWHLCGRWLDQCDPIYLSVTGSSARTNNYCSDIECQYPNQIKFEIKHEGMTCGAWAAVPSILLLVVGLLLHLQH